MGALNASGPVASVGWWCPSSCLQPAHLLQQPVAFNTGTGDRVLLDISSNST